MRLILIGCEYAGKHTLAVEISKWMMATMGLTSVRWHNHFVVPELNQHLVVTAQSTGAVAASSQPEVEAFSEADYEKILNLGPALTEQLQRHMIWRHLVPSIYAYEADYLLIDWYYADAVYAPLYYGYGGPNTFADRRRRARAWEAEVMKLAADTVLVLVHASPAVIRERLTANPRPLRPLREPDIETVLDGFEAEFADSLIYQRFKVDTTNASPADSLKAFLRQMAARWSPADQLRLVAAQALRAGHA